MKNKSKVLLGLLLTGVSGLSFANAANDNMDVTAKVNAACFIKASDVLFGEISNNAEQALNLSFKCNKGQRFTLSTIGKTNPGLFAGFFMTRNGVTVPNATEAQVSWTEKANYISENAIGIGIKYRFDVSKVPVTTEHYQITRLPYVNALSFNFGSGYDYSMDVVTKSGEEFTMTLNTVISSFADNKHRFPQGTYYDIQTMTVDF